MSEQRTLAMAAGFEKHQKRTRRAEFLSQMEIVVPWRELGRSSPAVARRAKELKVTFVYLGQAKKTEAFEDCLQKAGVREEEVAYMGDDLPDIPLARRAGLAVCVADGVPELKAVCHFTTTRLAGCGTAREVIELILKAQGRWEEAVPQALA